jgi:hypothetical protein
MNNANNTTGTVSSELIMGMHAMVIYKQIKFKESYFNAALVYNCCKSIAQHMVHMMKS